MKIICNPDRKQWEELTRRPLKEKSDLRELVCEISSRIKSDGDKALREYTRRFDNIELKTFLVSKAEIRKRALGISSKLRAAIVQAAENIRRFHQSQFEQETIVETSPGIQCWRKSIAIEKVGLYIPGGSAPLLSTLLMLAVPAKIAGCSRIIVCTPPDRFGKLSQPIAAAAEALGIDEVILLGGAQAILAMALGTETVLKVNKILGPGNQYVTTAKEFSALELGIAIDLPAGPSELLVIADKGANAGYIAADLLSQAEHGEDSQVILLTDSEKLCKDVIKEIKVQLFQLSRNDVAKSALSNSLAIVFSDLKQAIDFSNLYAPEHLTLAVRNARLLSEQIINAGSVFLGNSTPESLGDYASGTNHTLPTNGAARSYSGVSLDSFIKKVTFQKASPSGLGFISDTVCTLAKAEGLDGHARAVSIRMQERGATNE